MVDMESLYIQVVYGKPGCALSSLKSRAIKIRHLPSYDPRVVVYFRLSSQELRECKV